MKRTVLLAALMLGLAGCYTTKLHYGDIDPGRTSTHLRLQHTFFWGFLSPGSTNLSNVCRGQQVVSIKSQLAGLGLLANWLTAGIWSPMTITVVCADAPATAALEPDAQ